MDTRTWLKSLRYLPDFLRDFHAQKEVFKWMHSTIPADNFVLGNEQLSWTAAHVFVIDFFLWHMARCGWTLQRSRVKAEFDDVHEIIGAYKAEKMAAFHRMLDKGGAK